MRWTLIKAVAPVSVVSVLAVAAGIGSACAAYHGPIDPAISQWFHTLTNPNTNILCCDVADGHLVGPGDWRIGANGYQVFIRGRWRDVPPIAVLNHVSDPLGSPVVFYGPGYYPQIYCFVRGPES